MALEKIITIDKIEVVGEWKFIQVRERIDIKDGDQIISSSFERYFFFVSSEVGCFAFALVCWVDIA